jgi:hypothetical protein
MAGREPSTTRRRVLGGAAALPVAAFLPAAALPAPALPAPALPAPAEPSPDRAAWERRLGEYLRIAREAEEAAESGWFAAANARYRAEYEAVAARFGSWEAAAASPEGRRLRRAAFARVCEAEELYWDRCTEPMQKAAVALALTPAPDVAAVRDKARAMRLLQLHELDCMTRDCFEVIEEDLGWLAAVARLQGGD